MRHFTSSLGLTLLAAAVTLGVVSREKKELSERQTIKPVDSLSPPSSSLPSYSPVNLAQDSPPSPTALRDFQEYASVENMAQARLAELSAELYLTATQEQAIEPAVIRMTHGYSSEKAYRLSAGTIHRNLGPPLSRAAFEDHLFSLLDGEQQLDYAASIAERDAWWSDIISRLESQLEAETSPNHDLPSPSPSPPPTPEPSKTPGTIHPGRNLFQAPTREES